MQILVALSLATGSLACIGGLLGGGGGGCCPSAAPSCGNPCGPRPVVGYAAAPPAPLPPPEPVPAPAPPANAYPVAPQQFQSPPLAVPPPPPPHPSPFPAAPQFFPPAPPPPAPVAVQPIPFFGMTQQSQVPSGYVTPLHQGFQQQVNAATGTNFVPSSLFGQQISSGFGQPSATNSYAQGISGTAGYQAPSTFAQQAIAPVPEQQSFQQQQVAVVVRPQQPNTYEVRPTEQVAADQGSISNTGVGTAVEQTQVATGGEYRAQVQQQVVQQQDIASGGTEVHYDDVQEPSNEKTTVAQPIQPSPEPQSVSEQAAVAPVDPVQPQVIVAPTRPQPYIQPAHIATHVIETIQHVAEPAQPHTVVVEEVVKVVKPVDPAPTFPAIPEVHRVVQTVQPVVQPIQAVPHPVQPTTVVVSRPVVQQVITPVQPVHVPPQPQPTQVVEVKQSIDNQEQIVSETTEGGDEQNYDDVEAVEQVVPQPRPVPQVSVPQVPVPQVSVSQVVVSQPKPIRPVPQISFPIVVTESKTPVQPYHPQVTPVQPAQPQPTVVVQQPTPVMNKVFKEDPVMPSPSAVQELDNLLNPIPVTTTAAPIVDKKVHSGSLDFHQVTEELRTTPKTRSTIPSATRFTTEPPVTIALPDSSESTKDKPSSSSSGSTEQQQQTSGENYDDELPETTTLKQVIPAKEVKPLEPIPVAPAKIAVAPAQIPVAPAKTPVVAAKIEVEAATRASKVEATEVPTTTTTRTTTAPTTTTAEIQSIDLAQSADYDDIPPHEEPPHEERPEIPVPAESFNGAETSTSAPVACAAGDPNCNVACKAGDAHCGQEELAQEIVEPEQKGFDYGDGVPESHEAKTVIVNSENEAKATGTEYPETKAAGTRQLASFPLKAAASLQPVDNYRRRRFNRA